MPKKTTISAAEAAQADPVTESQTKEEAASKPQAKNAASGSLSALSTQPLEINSVKLPGASGEISLGCGLYLVLGAAGAGKSTVSMGLVATATLSGAAQSGHLYFFEVGAPKYAERDEIAMFSDPRRFLEYKSGGDLETYLSPVIAHRTPRSAPMIILLDSIGTPLRSFLSTERVGMAASEGGMQPADRMFVERLDALGVARSIVFLGVLNTELVPFASKLYGATQGVIHANNAYSFSKSDRVTGRKTIHHSIKRTAVEIALGTMRYVQQDGGDYSSFNY